LTGVLVAQTENQQQQNGHLLDGVSAVSLARAGGLARCQALPDCRKKRFASPTGDGRL